MSNTDRIWYYCVYIYDSVEMYNTEIFSDEKWTVFDNEDGRALQDVIDLINEREIYRSKEGKGTYTRVVIKCLEEGVNDESI